MKRRNLIAKPRDFPVSSSSVMLLLTYILLLPFASPFVVGTYSGATNIGLSASAKNPRPLEALASSSSSSSGSSSGSSSSAETTTAAETTASPNHSDGFLRKLIRNLNPTSGKKNNRWKGGENKATIPSRLLFRYVSPLLEIASKRELSESDAFETPTPRKMASTVPRLKRTYNLCRSRSHSSESFTLAKSLVIHQRETLILTAVLRLINTAVQGFPAILVARLLRLIESGEQHPASVALRAAVTLIVFLSIKTITENQYFHNAVKCATMVRGSIDGLIFDKSLRLPSGNENVGDTKKKNSGAGAGTVLNLMQSDAAIVESAFLQFHTIWDSPLQIAMYTTLLYRYMGRSILWGVGVLLTLIPINSWLVRVLTRMGERQTEAQQARTSRTTEAISNMKLLKLQAWEDTFANDIRKSRNEELWRHVSRGLVRAVSSAVSNAVPVLVLVVTLSAYARTGKPIVASTIFTAISLFNQLRMPLFFLPNFIDSLSRANTSLKRISSFLVKDEIVPYVVTMPPLQGKRGQIELKDGNFVWPTTGDETKSSTPALTDANLTVYPGEVVAVVGSTGAGKSALVKGLLGELVPKATPPGLWDKPSVVSYGNIAYCSQEAWLPKGTLREAVLFGREYNEERYFHAIRDAGLDDDIVETQDKSSRGVLSHDSDVGEGGSSLSGGQRARVALARALYGDTNTTVFLFDDPLAALDASVGSTVFERLVQRLRNSGAAAVLVTNDPNLPRRCDRVVLMGKSVSAPPSSSIIDVGRYDDLIARGHDLQSLVATDLDDDEEEEEEDRVAPSEGGYVVQHNQYVPANDTSTFIRVLPAVESTTSDCTVFTQHANPDCVECAKQVPALIGGGVSVKTNAKPDFGQLQSTPRVENIKEPVIAVQGTKKLASVDETMAKGAVPFRVYVAYLKSVRKPLLIVSLLAAYILAMGAKEFQQFVIAQWTNIGKNDAMATALGAKYLRSLVFAGGVVSVALWIRAFLVTLVGVRASRSLHDRLLTSVFSGQMSFFDSTPSGQILSRFGKEMTIVDMSLPDSFSSFLYCFLEIGTSAFALASGIAPIMLIPIALAGVFYVRTMGRFRPAARDLKRSESRTRSPIFTHFGEALRGKETIRSIPHADSYWSSVHFGLTDNNLSTYSAVKALDRWLSMRLENLGNLTVLSAAVASVILTRTGRLKAGSAGWGLTRIMGSTSLLTWAVRTLTDLETNMMSMARVQELTDLDSEKTKGDFSENRLPKEKTKPGEALLGLYSQTTHPNVPLTPLQDTALMASGWPWKGNIQFKNVSMRYNPVSPLVLKGVTINVPPGTTLGVVGRTGSGKSSLLLTLFRLVEIESGGSILIDGVDIRSVSLPSLRRSLSIIPQDPVLFAGTLMYNLDATGKANREEAWAALEAASPELAKEFKATGLDTQIIEGGKNLSSGQRQLICLARALLRKSKILVMDEATSSVDSKTDAQVQATIKREFVNKGVTVLTVAHRLDTVLGYDKIAVLGSGALMEYGPPPTLLRNPNGELRRLVNADRQNKRKGSKQNEYAAV